MYFKWELLSDSRIFPVRPDEASERVGIAVPSSAVGKGTRMVAEIRGTETRIGKKTSAVGRREGRSSQQNPATAEIARRHEVKNIYFSRQFSIFLLCL